MWIFKRSIIEGGANPSKVLKTRNRLFKWILKWTETQCKEANNHLTAKLLLLYEVSIFLLLCSCINKRAFTEVWWTVYFISGTQKQHRAECVMNLFVLAKIRTSFTEKWLHCTCRVANMNIWFLIRCYSSLSFSQCSGDLR